MKKLLAGVALVFGLGFGVAPKVDARASNCVVTKYPTTAVVKCYGYNASTPYNNWYSATGICRNSYGYTFRVYTMKANAPVGQLLVVCGQYNKLLYVIVTIY